MTTSGTFAVYIITNTVNGNRYVGFTSKSISDRWKRHVRSSRRGSKLHIHNAIRKHGETAFLIGAVSTHATKDDATAAEISLISLVRPEYNMTRGGDGVVGYKITDEQRSALRQRMTEYLIANPHPCAGTTLSLDRRTQISIRMKERPIKYWLGKKQPKEMVEKRAISLRGKRRSLEAIEKTRQKNLGRKFSEEVRANMSAAIKAAWASPERREAQRQRVLSTAKRKPVKCITTGVEFTSVRDASAVLGIHPRLIYKACAGGKNKTANGMTFKWTE